ncbi:MAG TPA: hypothetical protein VG870_11775, partial [Chitinophagaceae bacterium]|nr:hypothetical protein [Chitinophagaceae bacterium]
AQVPAGDEGENAGRLEPVPGRGDPLMRRGRQQLHGQAAILAKVAYFYEKHARGAWSKLS